MPQDTVPLHVRARRERRAVTLGRLGYRTYGAYLRSGHWFDVRRAYRESDLPQRCMCGADEVQLHHKTYERLGCENLTDLVPLCATCHKMIHTLEWRGEIALDFQGFESLARAVEYAKQTAAARDRARREHVPWTEEGMARYIQARRERSRARRRRGSAKKQNRRAV